MQAPKIEVKNVYKIFHQHILDSMKTASPEPKTISNQDKMVIEDLNLECKSGESIGIIGRNGAGKSTLLSMIAGLAQQSSGQIQVQGKVTAVMTLGIGLREDLSGRDNIYLDGELQGKTRAQIEDVIDEIIAFSELGEFIDKPIKFYSTGMKSRLAFSMLVCIEPEILIIDEALSAGDVFFAEKASKKIKEICSKGKIVLLVSHSMASIQTLCNRCLWMEKGKIIQDGEPSLVTAAYLQKVQEEDESIELKQFQKDIIHTEDWANYLIRSVEFKVNGADYSQKVFHSEDSLLIDLKIHRKQSPNESILNFAIERIDGVILHVQDFDLSKVPEDFTLSFALDFLCLNKGYYQLKLDVHEERRLSNQWALLFEVKNNKMATGGYSLLHYPAEITLLTKENSRCLDSIELMVD